MSIIIGYTCWRCEFYGWFLILSLDFLIFFKFFTIYTYWCYFIVMMNIFKHSMFVFQNHISVLTHIKILSTVPPKLLTANCCQTENSEFCAYTIQSLEQNIGPHTWTLIIRLWHFSGLPSLSVIKISDQKDPEVLSAFPGHGPPSGIRHLLGTVVCLSSDNEPQRLKMNHLSQTSVIISPEE